MRAIAARNAARGIRVSASERERLAFWAGRKAAFPAVGRLSPDYYCMDGTIPRRELPRVLRAMVEMQQRYGLRVANVFHAGDGNLHPLILYDANVPGELDKAEAFGFEILKLCVDVGGVLTGEHGVGLEKRDLMTYQFDAVDLEIQHRVKHAFDPDVRFNPGKVFPTLRRCAEQGREHVHVGRGTLRASAAVLTHGERSRKRAAQRRATQQTSPRSSPRAVRPLEPRRRRLEAADRQAGRRRRPRS